MVGGVLSVTSCAFLVGFNVSWQMGVVYWSTVMCLLNALWTGRGKL